MYCPNCATKTSESQRFCRSCGLALEKIVESLAEQMPNKVDETLLQRKERLERLGLAALSIFGLSFLGFLLYIVFNKLMLTQGRFLAALAVLGVFIVIGCGLLSVILFAKANELKEAATKRPLDRLNERPAGDSTGKLLDAHREPVFSVSDRTTDLLSVKRVSDASRDE